MIELYDEVAKSDLHDKILNKFLNYQQPKIKRKIYKLPEIDSSENFQFNRVVLLCDDAVYKIHLSIYRDFQKNLANNLHNFFKYYSKSLNFSDHYRSDICWTKWDYVEGQNLGLQEFDDDIWMRYLDYIKKWWNEHLEVSKQLSVVDGYMWWHNDVTALNVINGIDGNFHLIDWDDFKLCEINQAKEKLIKMNTQYSEIMNQNIDILNKSLGEL